MTVAPRVEIALIHHPVISRTGEEIGAAVTGIDVHDIARAARTFGVRRVFVVTPYGSQQALVAELVRHWTSGAGGRHNPDRADALSLVRLAAGLGEVVAAGDPPLLVATSARPGPKQLGWDEARELAGSGRRLVLLFGTASGLAPRMMEMADHRLAPITGPGTYNHLSVRSAVAIVLDRLFGSTGR